MILPKPAIPPNFAPQWRAGSALTAWPPPGYRAFYEVGSKPGASWQTVSAGWGVLVPDLIWFNFGTDDPRLINWYLHHYVGCWQSNDGKNFSFKGADPGFLYIPPFHWKRPDPLPLGARVAEALMRVASHIPTVAFRGMHVSQTDILHIVQLIRDGRIVVRHDPAMTGAFAEYFRGREPEELVLSSTALTSLKNRQAFAHEAVHAVQDLKRYRNLRWEREFLAYTIGALFYFSVAPSDARRRIRSTGTHAVHRAAFLLASYIHADRKKGKAFFSLETYNSFVQADDGKWINPFEVLQNAILTHVRDSLDVISGDGI